MSVKRKFKLLKAIIASTRPTERGDALTDLNNSLPGLFQATSLMREMTAAQINELGTVENGVMTISLDKIIGVYGKAGFQFLGV